MTNPTISIIVPVYNAEDYINQCLESITTQSYSNLEVICVDDCSTDNTVDIIKKWQNDYSFIKLIEHKKNLKGSKTRKDGVNCCSGDYVMFVDSDDYLSHDACKIALDAIMRNNTDIVQFDTNVVNASNLPSQRIESNKRALRPFERRLEGNLIQACFIDRKFSFTLWNKIYRAEIIREAFSYVDDGEYPKANDLYPAFFILYCAHSYFGIKDELYNYCFGRGMTGHNSMSLSEFEKCCKSVYVYKKLVTFAISHPEVSEAVEQIGRNLIGEQCAALLNQVDEENRSEAMDIMQRIQNCSLSDLIVRMAASAWQRKVDFAELFLEKFKADNTGKEIRTIALYYRNIRGGGAQRVVANLATWFAEYDGGTKFDIVLVTDEMPDERDYYVSSKVTRVVIPSYEKRNGSGYEERARAIYNVIDSHKIDLIIDSMWCGPSFFWDLMVAKTHPRQPAVVAHTHSFFSFLFSFAGHDLKEMCSSYAILDGIVVLSELDRNFWSLINDNVFFIPNQLEERYRNVEKKQEPNGNVLWAGRISEEKQVLDIIRIMEKVVCKIPDAECYILGSGEEQLTQELEKAVSEKGLEKNIHMEGYCLNVEEYYRKCSVYLCTSKFEGFPLALYEASAFGLPVVMYELPWLEYCNSFKGYRAVPQRHSREAAEAICELLSNKTTWQSASEETYKCYNIFANEDHNRRWLDVIGSIENGVAADDRTDMRNKIVLSSIVSFHDYMIQGYKDRLRDCRNETHDVKRILQRTYDEKAERGVIIKAQMQEAKEKQKELKAIKKELKEVKKELKAIKNSRSFKLAKIIRNIKAW